MKKDFHIVSTRILSQELLRHLESYGLQVTVADFIEKKIRVPANIQSVSLHPILVFTSKTAVQSWMEISRELPIGILKFPVYCLAMATQTTALEHGLNIAGVAEDADSLADLILKDKSIKAVTFVCGNRRRDDLPDKLKKNGVDVLELEAYKTEYTPIKIDRPFNGVLFFSPSAVDSFLVFNSAHSAVAFCLGKTTADRARLAGFSDVHVAESHTPESVLKSVIDFYLNFLIHA